jgi:Putative metallopeptidase
LEPVAAFLADQLVWPTPFTLEMQSCGFVNARWVASTHKLTLCYELATDFAELYRDYSVASADKGKRNSSRRHK